MAMTPRATSSRSFCSAVVPRERLMAVAAQKQQFQYESALQSMPMYTRFNTHPANHIPQVRACSRCLLTVPAHSARLCSSGPRVELKY